MAVKKGRVVAVRDELHIEVAGEKHFIPKGCDPIIGPQLESFAGKEVEVLITEPREPETTPILLAIRAIKPEEVLPIKPLIICYLYPPPWIFEQENIARIEPILTKSLLESGRLDSATAKRLDEWKGITR